MRIARDGISRTVFVFTDYVVKVPKVRYGWYFFLVGLVSNIEEKKTWDATKSELLCPIRWMCWGGWILVMDRADVCREGDSIDYSLFALAGFGGDDKPDNYGLLRGRLVKIDYPNFSSKSIIDKIPAQ